MTYRDSEACSEIIEQIQQHVTDTEHIIGNLESNVEQYISAVKNPDLPIVHDLRTVYPKGIRGHIAEEKRLAQQSIELMPHIVPLASRKIAARPNAVISGDTLWVRQHLNWMSMERGKEYYLFQQLTSQGVNRGRCAVFSYDENGNIKNVEEVNIELEQTPDQRLEFKTRLDPPECVRSESYWKIPTLLDSRLVDLEFIERRSKPGDAITSSQLVELYVLRKIVETARAKLVQR